MVVVSSTLFFGHALLASEPPTGPADPSGFLSVFNVPDDPLPAGIGPDTQLNLLPGSRVDDAFSAGSPQTAGGDLDANIEVNLLGGLIDRDFRAFGETTFNHFEGTFRTADTELFEHATYNLVGGTAYRIQARDHAEVNIYGGEIDRGIEAYDRVVVNISGGATDSLDLNVGTLTTISGGQIDDVALAGVAYVSDGDFGGRFSEDFVVSSGGFAEISGGRLAGLTVDQTAGVNLSGGIVGRINAKPGNALRIGGGDFRLNGLPLTVPPDGLTLRPDDVLTGVLGDGTPMILSPLAGDAINNVHILEIPVPIAELAITLTTESRLGGVREGQSVYAEPSAVVGDDFSVVDGSLHVKGAIVGSRLEVARGQVIVNGGSIGDDLGAFDQSIVEIRGGSIGERFTAHRGSQVQVSGGRIDNVTVAAGATLDVSGGSVVGLTQIEQSGRVEVTGGRLSGVRVDEFGFLTVRGGRVESLATEGLGANVVYVGSEFSLNGQTVFSQTVGVGAGEVLAGLHPDGSVFVVKPDVASDFIGVRLQSEPLDTPPPMNVVVGSGDLAPAGLAPGATLTLQEGGRLPDGFGALRATINIEGGTARGDLNVVGGHLELSSGNAGQTYLYDGGTANLTGGVSSLVVGSSSVVNMTGGSHVFQVEERGVVNIGGDPMSSYVHATVHAGGVINQSGGYADEIRVFDGGVLNASGGVLRSLIANGTTNVFGGDIGELQIEESALVNLFGGSFGHVYGFGGIVSIHGGTFEGGIDWNGETLLISDGEFPGAVVLSRGAATITGGSFHEGIVAEAFDDDPINVQGGSFGGPVELNEHVRLVGGEFRLNGAPIGTDEAVSLGVGDTLSGTLASGSPFVFSYRLNDRVSEVTLEPVSLEEADLVPAVIDAVSDRPGLRPGQTLAVTEGGTLPASFRSIDAVLNVDGGAIGEDLRIAGGELSVTAGTVEDVAVLAGATVSVVGGQLNRGARVHGPSVADVSGGQLLGVTLAESGGVINVSGDAQVDLLRVNDGGVVDMEGGMLDAGATANTGGQMTLRGGSLGRRLLAYDGSNVEVQGGEFELNGSPIASSEDVMLGPGDVLTGTLTDGSPFAFASVSGDVVEGIRLQATTLPPTSATPIVINDATDRSGLRAGETLTLEDGGVLPQHFQSVNAILDIDGGTVGSGLQAAGGAVNMSAGTASELELLAEASGHISGGEVTGSVTAYEGASLQVSGNADVSRVVSTTGAVVTQTGGWIQTLITESGSTTVFSGGSLPSSLALRTGSSISLEGGEFYLNGDPVAAGQDVLVPAGDVLSGVLADGSAIVYAGSNFGADITFSLVDIAPTPAATSPITVNTLEGPRGLRPTEQMRVEAGGVLPEAFQLAGGALEIDGGVVGDGMRATRGTVRLVEGELGNQARIVSGAQLTVEGGSVGFGLTIGDDAVATIAGGTYRGISGLEGSTIDITGGVSTDGLSTAGVINISGGSATSVSASSGGVVNISGGEFGNGFRMGSDATININGGRFGSDVSTGSRNDVHIRGGSFGPEFETSGTFYGGEFLVNGEPIESGASVSVGSLDVVSGVLEDGSVVVFSGRDRDFVSSAVWVSTSVPPMSSDPVVVVQPEPAAQGLRVGQMMSVVDGGELPDDFQMAGGLLNVEGGTVGAGLEAAQGTIEIIDGNVGDELKAMGSAVVNLRGGSIGDRLRVSPGARLNVSGGTVGDRFSGYANLTGGSIGDLGSGSLDISGGSVGERFEARFGSTINISGGSIGAHLDMSNTAFLNISGGTIGEDLDAIGVIINMSGGSIGDDFTMSGGELHLFVQEASIGGAEITSLEIGQTRPIDPRYSVLEGILADGTPFRFDEHNTRFASFGLQEVLVTLTLVSGLAGDYSNNGVIDIADYTTWRDNVGASAGRLLNDPVGGPIGSAQYDAWVAAFGVAPAALGADTPATIPEPASLVLVSAAATAGTFYSRRSTRRTRSSPA